MKIEDIKSQQNILQFMNDNIEYDMNIIKDTHLSIYNLKEKQEFIKEIAILTQNEWANRIYQKKNLM